MYFDNSEDALEETLDKKLFSTLDSNVASSQISYRRGAARRLVVFILGGITYPEFRVASEVANEMKYKSTEIFVGGSKVLTPNNFIRDLKSLSRQHDGNTSSEESLAEREPLIGNGSSPSNQHIDDDNESLLATCEKHLSRGGRFITDTFTACTSNVCARSN